jgi:hypothetical protein
MNLSLNIVEGVINTMTSYLERYQNGEYEQVWAELVALGEGVRQEPVYSDAVAVARETMRRARHNIALIYERLKSINFRFEDPNHAFLPPDAEIIAQIDEFEREVGPIPLSLRAWAEVVGEVNFMGNYPGLSYFAAPMSTGFAAAVESGFNDSDAIRQMLDSFGIPPGVVVDDTLIKTLQEQLSQLNPLLLSLGKQAVQKAKDSPSWEHEQETDSNQKVVSDPLVVGLGEISADNYQDFLDYNEDEEFFYASIAPDIHHKSNMSGGGGYDVELPNGSVDFILLNEGHDFTFVEYLRLSFRWGGFPGLQDYDGKPTDLLNLLTKDLLPL